MEILALYKVGMDFNVEVRSGWNLEFLGSIVGKTCKHLITFPVYY
jgi:hypothetical protein